MAFATTTSTLQYKGRTISTFESPIQVVYLVDNDLERAYWSIADAKRAINGQPLKFYPVDVRHWAR